MNLLLSLALGENRSLLAASKLKLLPRQEEAPLKIAFYSILEYPRTGLCMLSKEATLGLEGDIGSWETF